MKTCYIFGAAEGLPESFTKEKDDIIIAADAGFLHLEKLGIKPDIVLGDFDSLGEIPDFNEIIKHPVKKDDTDTLLAVKTGFERGFKRFVLYGCAGKRLDHTFANIQTLYYIAERGGEAFLCGDDFTATAIKNGKILFTDKANGNISVFAGGEKAKNVNIKGLSYELENAEIGYDFPVGVSNEFVGLNSEISVNDGMILVIWSGGLDFIKK